MLDTPAARVLTALSSTANAARTRDESFHERMLRGAIASLSAKDFAVLLAAVDAARSSGHREYTHRACWAPDGAAARLLARFAGAVTRLERGVDGGALLTTNIAGTCADEFAALVAAVDSVRAPAA